MMPAMGIHFRTFLREPLLHFALIGVVLFALTPETENTERVIELDDALVRSLEQRFDWIEGHLPTAEEKEKLIESFLDEEVLVREARLLGLDQNDSIIRRRLAQKMRRLMEQWDSEPPSDETLQAFLDQHLNRYASPNRRSIEQVFFSKEKRGERCAVDAAKTLVTIRKGVSLENQGDPFLRGQKFLSKSESELAAVFGEPFAKAVFQMQMGQWMGLPSSFGTHVLRVVNQVPAEKPALHEIRERVLLDWKNDHKKTRIREALNQLRQQYTVKKP
jgi:peptidyl-prolyl cis-trans isomerase C